MFHHAAADSCLCAPCPSIWSQLSTPESESLPKKRSMKCTFWLFNYPLSLRFWANLLPWSALSAACKFFSRPHQGATQFSHSEQSQKPL